MTTTPQNNTPSASPAPLQKTTEQERAAQAWTDVTNVQAGYAKQYGSVVRKLPMLVLTNGLAASMAFLLAKGKPAAGQQISAENRANDNAYKHISAWVMRRLQPDVASTDDLMTWIRRQDSVAYRRATTETLAYLNWLKRFVEAQGWGRKKLRMPLPKRNLCLPQDTQAALTSDLNGCRNLGLLLDRFAPWAEESQTRDLMMRVRERRQGQDTIKSHTGGSAKGLWLRDVPTPNCLDPVLKPNSRIDWDLLEQASLRWEKSVSALGGQTFKMKVDYRLVVGFGAEHVLETNLCLHRIYGFPYIPGSAVKGVTRAYNYWRVADTLQVPILSAEEDSERRNRREKTPLEKLEDWLSEGDEQKRQQRLNELRNDLSCLDTANIRKWHNNQLLGVQRIFQARFGTTQAQGQVIFFDAFPMHTPNKPLLKLDVINPHVGKYYQGSQPPANYLDPVPTYFLTVEGGTIFQFAIVALDVNSTQEAATSVQRALTSLGVGGKTASGYGYMNP